MKKMLLVLAMMVAQSVSAQDFGCYNNYYNCKRVNSVQICKMEYNNCMNTKEIYFLKNNENLVNWDEYIKSKNYNENEWQDYTIKVRLKK